MGGSDLHITTTAPPRVRVNGKLRPAGMPPHGSGHEILAYSVLQMPRTSFRGNLELDFSFGLKTWRASAQLLQTTRRGWRGLRTIPWEIKGFECLGLASGRQGALRQTPRLVLVHRPTGPGKSTTLPPCWTKSQRAREQHDHHRGPQ